MTNSHRPDRARCLLGTSLLLAACSTDGTGGPASEAPTSGSGGTGASFSSEGTPPDSTGGVAQGGGNGGSAISGGSSGVTPNYSGGSPATGGRPGGGGSPATGADQGTGGSGDQTGGGSATGGAPSGGDTATGGTLSDPAADPITIWLAGDSTVANGNTPCPVGWGKAFQGEFNDRVTVANSAAGGRSVRTWLYNVTSTMGPDKECIIESDAAGSRVEQDRFIAIKADMKPGDYLFIQFGINDGSATCDRHVGLLAFQEEYAMLAQVARDRGAYPVFVTPVSAIACSGAQAIGTRGEFVTATIDVGTALDVPVIDLHQLSVDYYTEQQFCPVPGSDVSATTTGPVGDFFCDDHTHFSTTGAARIGALIAQDIANQGLLLAAYLR